MQFPLHVTTRPQLDLFNGGDPSADPGETVRPSPPAPDGARHDDGEGAPAVEQPVRRGTSILGGRGSLIGTVLGALLLGRGWVAPDRREWTLLVVCGVGWFGIYNVALNAAEQHLDAGTTAMLVNIGPILIAVFAPLSVRAFNRRM